LPTCAAKSLATPSAFFQWTNTKTGSVRKCGHSTASTIEFVEIVEIVELVLESEKPIQLF
jgi:hypothetical protein